MKHLQVHLLQVMLSYSSYSLFGVHLGGLVLGFLEMPKINPYDDIFSYRETNAKTTLGTNTLIIPPQERSKDINHLVEGLFSLSLDSDISSEISLKTACKLKEYVKIRNLMKFNLLSDRSAESSSYPFSHEEMGLLQKIPKGEVNV